MLPSLNGGDEIPRDRSAGRRCPWPPRRRRPPPRKHRHQRRLRTVDLKVTQQTFAGGRVQIATAARAWTMGESPMVTGVRADDKPSSWPGLAFHARITNELLRITHAITWLFLFERSSDDRNIARRSAYVKTLPDISAVYSPEGPPRLCSLTGGACHVLTDSLVLCSLFAWLFAVSWRLPRRGLGQWRKTREKDQAQSYRSRSYGTRAGWTHQRVCLGGHSVDPPLDSGWPQRRVCLGGPAAGPPHEGDMAGGHSTPPAAGSRVL